MDLETSLGSSKVEDMGAMREADLEDDSFVLSVSLQLLYRSIIRPPGFKVGPLHRT